MRTKIIATLGPSSNTLEKIEQLALAGANIFRLNFSHGNASQFADIVANIRAVAKKHGLVLTILQDLSGPKIRIGTLPETLTFNPGSMACIGPKEPVDGKGMPYIPFDNKGVLERISIGDTLVMADGTLEFTVVDRAGDLFIIKAGNSGMLTSKKGLALPGKAVNVAALTEKDKKDLVDGLDLGVDAVALSFVQSAEDILEARKIIRDNGKDIPICAKLERRNAVDRLEEILDVVDIVMVARGDLGIDCPLSQIPGLQKRILQACNRHNIPVIVATQMLLSMVTNPAPSRAETTDVANAVLDGADCVMMSEETAMGKFPVEAVAYMQRIAADAETLMVNRPRCNPLFAAAYNEDFESVGDFLSYSACLLARRTNAAGIVCHSLSGESGRCISSQRPEQEIHVLTQEPAKLHYLNFSWGVSPHLSDQSLPSHLDRVEKFIKESSRFKKGDTLLITAGQYVEGYESEGSSTNLVKIYVK